MQNSEHDKILTDQTLHRHIDIVTEINVRIILADSQHSESVYQYLP